MPASPAKTVAVIGASTDGRKFGNKGVRAFLKAGWRVIPVNPNEALVEGLATAASVADIAERLDVVSLYVPAAVGVKLLPAIAAKGAGELWVNPGAESAELLAAAVHLGLRVSRPAQSSAWAFHRRLFQPIDSLWWQEPTTLRSNTSDSSCAFRSHVRLPTAAIMAVNRQRASLYPHWRVAHPCTHRACARDHPLGLRRAKCHRHLCHAGALDEVDDTRISGLPPALVRHHRL